MAEAEDVITDVARHATVYAQALWRRHRVAAPEVAPVMLADVAQRLDLLIAAVFGSSHRLRTAQAPAPSTFLAKTFQPRERPQRRQAVPATDDVCIWLPPETGLADPALALERFRTAALQQAMRASRGSAAHATTLATPLLCDLYLLVEAHAADAALAHRLPGLAGALNRCRRHALAARPPLASFAPERRALEVLVQQVLACDCTSACANVPASASPDASVRTAQRLADGVAPDPAAARRLGSQPLWKDWWTGEFRVAEGGASLRADASPGDDSANDPATAPRSARLARRPEVRAAASDEDDARQGAWMIQAAPPQEHAEDPFGLQRPTDRDTQTAADEYADSIAELAQARLVSSPGRPKEVLLSDDPPDARAKPGAPSGAGAAATAAITYPEWDCRIGAHRHPGATVRLLAPAVGPQPWVDSTLDTHRALLVAIRRRFEMLRAERVRLRRQFDGDDLDLDACIDAQADRRAGLPMPQALYRSQRRARRDLAILLLIDVSGSTDGWVSAQRRVIDVEREALLLVCIALDALGEPYAVQAFSGDGPHAVTVRTLKRFDEPYANAVALRIAALEPEQATRTGAAIRHATATLRREPAAQRLLLLLSDGKPNDVDVYEGRYGIEDTREAVTEARLEGVAPFCLTVDRHAAAYLPAVFGARHYALLTQPERLPSVLLDWMRRLVVA